MKNTHPLMRIVLTLFTILVAMFFVLPLLWFAFAPFNEQATLGIAIPDRLSLANFETVFDNQLAIRALIQNSMIIGVGSMIGTALVAALTAYGLSAGSGQPRHCAIRRSRTAI